MSDFSSKLEKVFGHPNLKAKGQPSAVQAGAIKAPAVPVAEPTVSPSMSAKAQIIAYGSQGVAPTRSGAPTGKGTSEAMNPSSGWGKTV